MRVEDGELEGGRVVGLELRGMTREGKGMR